MALLAYGGCYLILLLLQNRFRGPHNSMAEPHLQGAQHITQPSHFEAMPHTLPTRVRTSIIPTSFKLLTAADTTAQTTAKVCRAAVSFKLDCPVS